MEKIQAQNQSTTCSLLPDLYTTIFKYIYKYIQIYEHMYKYAYKYEIKYVPIFRCRINPWLVRSSLICRKLADSSPLSFQLLGLCKNVKLLPNVQSWSPSDILNKYLSEPLLQEARVSRTGPAGPVPTLPS